MESFIAPYIVLKLQFMVTVCWEMTKLGHVMKWAENGLFSHVAANNMDDLGGKVGTKCTVQNCPSQMHSVVD